jgi:N-acyl-D-aspartate/D-glutamate deacylase
VIPDIAKGGGQMTVDPGAAGDLLLRGGTVIDGTGAASVRADVRARNGRIVEVGSELRPDSESVIDASGAYVTPGFIESHTHYDAAVWWDPDCDPCQRTDARPWSSPTAASDWRH